MDPLKATHGAHGPSQACSDFETSRSTEISENVAAISAAETTAATLKGDVADVKQLLLETQNALKDDRGWVKTW